MRLAVLKSHINDATPALLNAPQSTCLVAMRCEHQPKNPEMRIPGDASVCRTRAMGHDTAVSEIFYEGFQAEIDIRPDHITSIAPRRNMNSGPNSMMFGH